MSRLTRKIRDDDYSTDYFRSSCAEDILNKLGPLEDIEEEFNINLNLFDILNQLKIGVYLKDLRDYEPITFVRAITLGYYKRWYLEYDYFIYNVEDYGKTWAFTREELEKHD